MTDVAQLKQAFIKRWLVGDKMTADLDMLLAAQREADALTAIRVGAICVRKG